MDSMMIADGEFAPWLWNSHFGEYVMRQMVMGK